MSSIVLVTEKPSVDRAVLPLAQAVWGDQQTIYSIPTLYLGLYEFRYPRGLSRQDYPHISEPTWKRRQRDYFVYGLQSGEVVSMDLCVDETLHRASEIIFACDPDASGAIAFHTLLSQVLGDESAARERRALRLSSVDPTTLKRALFAPLSTKSEWFVGLLAAGQCRRFFDYNFNTNALAILNDVLRSSGMPSPAAAISKYGLQLLYWMRKNGAHADGALIHAMTCWSSTGRYAGNTQLGSPASQSQIICNLLDAELIVRSSDGALGLAAQGEAFLSALHPDCEDADLPFRLRQWEASWPVSRPSVERYLRTFFGKSARFTPRRSGSALKAGEDSDVDGPKP